MPYDLPSADNFFARFPVMGDKDPDYVTVMIAEAARTVDISWDEDDYQPAILYLAAHLIATDNSQEGETVQIGGLKGALSGESFAGMSRSYYDKTAGSPAASSIYGGTEYGRRFFTLLKNNKPAITVV